MEVIAKMSQGPSRREQARYVAYRAELLALLALQRVGGLAIQHTGNDNVPYDHVVTTSKGVSFYVEVKSFSSMQRRRKDVAQVADLPWDMERAQLLKLQSLSKPVVLFVIDADTDHGRFLRLDTLKLPDATKDEVTLFLPKRNSLDTPYLTRLIEEIGGLRKADETDPFSPSETPPLPDPIDAAQHDPGGKSRPLWPADSIVDATFSPCGRYRYALSEIWDPSLPLVMWVLMNPSVAGREYSDPTLRKTGMFSRSWGFGGQLVGNVHAYRATDKMRLLEVDDPVGPENDKHLLEMGSKADKIVLAFGKPPKQLQQRGQQVIELLRSRSKLHYLRLLKDGVTPEHPLYLPAKLKPKPYPFRTSAVPERRTET